MFRNNSKLNFFDAENDTNSIEELTKDIDVEIASKRKDEQMPKTVYPKMIAWLKLYVNSKDFFSVYDQESLAGIAAATFWSVKLGLEPFLAKMSYAEIRKFRPLTEANSENTERAKLVGAVLSKLELPAIVDSAAVGQAAWCVYVHNGSYENLKEEQHLYELANKPKFRS